MTHATECCFELSKKYFAMSPVREINLELLDNLSFDEQKKVLECTVQHNLSVTCPPSLAYRRAFIKRLIAHAEANCKEVHDDLYEIYTQLLQENLEEFCFKTYIMPDGQGLAVKESTKLISQGTTGLNTWQAALCLSEWLLEHKEILNGRSVLELGSGLGLTGLVAIKQCDLKSFIFSDCHGQVLHLLKDNIDLNLKNNFRLLPVTDQPECSQDSTGTFPDKKSCIGRGNSSTENTDSTGNERTDIKQLSHAQLASETQTHEHSCPSHSSTCRFQSKNLDDRNSSTALDQSVWMEASDNPQTWIHRTNPAVSVSDLNWETVSEEELAKLFHGVDIIIAADVVYDIEIIPALLRVLGSFLHGAPNCRAYIASTIRNPDTKGAFLGAIDAANIEWDYEDTPGNIFHYDRSVPIEILKLACS